MSLLKRAALVIAVTGLGLVNYEARADHWSFGRNHRTYEPVYSHSSHGYGSGGLNYNRDVYRSTGNGDYYRTAPSPTYHNTTHFDYHPTEVVRHRNHLDVQRGHYDLHRTGHWDW